MLEEPREGVAIVHASGGSVCGGSPDGKKVLQALKQNKLKNFTASLSGVEFVKHKKALFSFLRAVCSEDTMYTHVTILEMISPTLDHQLDQLKEKENHYTSFVHFFGDFQKAIFPDLDAIVVKEVYAHKQGKRCIREYHSSLVNLLKIVGLPQDHFIKNFLDGLENSAIRQKLLEREKPASEETLKSIAEHAIKIEEAKTPAGSAGNAGNDQAVRPKQAQNKASIATADSSDQDDEIKKAVKYVMRMKMKRCIACFGNHTYENTTEHCESKKCFFCGISFKNRRKRHFSALCAKAPKDRDSLIEILKQANDQANVKTA